MHPTTDKETPSKNSFLLMYLEVGEPLANLVNVLSNEILRRDGAPLRERNTARRLLSDIVDDGYDVYHVALAIQYLVRGNNGPIITAKICALPTMIAGLGRTSENSKVAKYVYWFDYIQNEAMSTAYNYYLDILVDAIEGGNDGMRQTVEKKLNKIALGAFTLGAFNAIS